MKRQTVAQLQAEIETLKKRIAQLEARPANQEVHHHYHQPPSLIPLQPTPPWRPLWNGPRNPDGSCAPLGSATITAHGGWSEG